MLILPKRFLIGAHVSIAKGLHYAFQRGKDIGCHTIQIFTKSARQWASRPLSSEEVQSFKKGQKESGIKPVIAHASYLINIGSSNPTTEHQGFLMLKEELVRCIQLNIPYLVLHPGSAGSDSFEECLSRISKNLNQAFKDCPGVTMILLENTAGQGSSVGASFENLSCLLNKSDYPDRLGFCFDTCHAFAAGYSFATPHEYEELWKKWDSFLGLNKLKVIHINDSQKEKGSRVDRHAHVGQGKMGLEPFRLLINDSRFFGIPKILETPKESPLDDKTNLETLCNLLSQETKDLLEKE